MIGQYTLYLQLHLNGQFFFFISIHQKLLGDLVLSKTEVKIFTVFLPSFDLVMINNNLMDQSRLFNQLCPYGRTVQLDNSQSYYNNCKLKKNKNIKETIIIYNYR